MENPYFHRKRGELASSGEWKCFYDPDGVEYSIGDVFKIVGESAVFTSLTFKNFRALEDCELPLGRITVLVGPNGSGKSTVLLGLRMIQEGLGHLDPSDLLSASKSMTKSNIQFEIKLNWKVENQEAAVRVLWSRSNGNSWSGESPRVRTSNMDPIFFEEHFLKRMEIFSFDENRISEHVPLKPNSDIANDGSGLAGHLDWLRDHHPEQFEALNAELPQWVPEFDRILFDVPQDGCRSINLRTRVGHHSIPAKSLSSGTLIALVFLSLIHNPTPPPLIAIEEPDRGIHPRLLRRIQDAIYRLAYPAGDRAPVQVICTTHSPYFLDLFSEHPEEIVIAEKTDAGTKFTLLSEKPNIQEILEGAPLGDIWFSGILGGVPTES